MHRSHFDRRQALRLMTTTAMAGTSLAQAGAWRPSPNITYTVGVAPGGSMDLYPHGIKQVLDNLKLLNSQTIATQELVAALGAGAL